MELAGLLRQDLPQQAMPSVCSPAGEVKDRRPGGAGALRASLTCPPAVPSRLPEGAREGVMAVSIRRADPVFVGEVAGSI